MILANLQNPKVFNNCILLKTIAHLVFIIHHVISFFIYMKLASRICMDGVDQKVKVLLTMGGLFATNWNFLFQSVFLFLALAYDIQEWRKREHTSISHKIKYYRDVTFCGLVLPLTLFVSTFFWVIYAVDRELIYPVIYDTVVPFWFNHCVHTNIAVLVLLETLLQSRRHPMDQETETTCVVSIAVGYAVVYYAIHFLTQRWLYKVFAIMSWWQICLFQLLIWSFNYFCYKIQFPINRIFHKEEKQEADSPVPNVDEMAANEAIEEKNKEDGEHCYSDKSLYLKCRSVKEQCEKTKF